MTRTLLGRKSKLAVLVTRGTLVAAIGFALLVLAGPAQASSIVFIGRDGNVHLTTPDGSRTAQVTRDASSSRVYRSPTQANDGTIVVGANDRRIHILNPNGSTKAGPFLTQAELGGPFNPQVSPDGQRVVYDYLPVTTTSTDFYTETMTTSGNDPGCEMQCRGSYAEPRWIPGTSNAFAIRASDGHNVTTLTDDWFAITDNSIESLDLSPTADNRVLMLTVPDGGGAPTLDLFQNNGTPPDTGAGPTGICDVVPFASEVSNPRFSPDGASMTWHDAQGVWSSPISGAGGGRCSISPKLIAAGGSAPSWGPADVPPSPATTPTTTDGGPTGGGRQTIASVISKGLKVKVKCKRKCKVGVTAMVSKATASKLRLGRRATAVGKGRGSLKRKGTKIVTVKLTLKAKRAIKKAKKVTFNLKIRTTYGKRSKTTSRRVTVSR